MTQSNTTGHETQSENMQDSPMMAHLTDALKRGTDIGHYGRLTFVKVTTQAEPLFACLRVIAKEKALQNL